MSVVEEKGYKSKYYEIEHTCPFPRFVTFSTSTISFHLNIVN
jgi:hypothetical protein